jgi:cytoskeletal protein CcmA (bactofilin family)
MASSGNSAESLGSASKFTLGSAASHTASSKANATVIGPEAVVQGDLKSRGDLIVAGVVEGEVASEARVTIAAGGSVVGRVSAVEVLIEGKLVGDSIASKSLGISNSAEVRGDVTTPVIMIEPGATFVGRCSMGEPAKVG